MTRMTSDEFQCNDLLNDFNEIDELENSRHILYILYMYDDKSHCKWIQTFSAVNIGKSAVSGTRAFKEKVGNISRRIVRTWYLYAFMDKLAIRLWTDGLNLNVILMFLPIWFCHTPAIALTWQPVSEPINGVTGTWLSCFATCDWLRALVHLHCDVIITTPTTKNMVVLPIVGARIAMLMEENLPSKYNVNGMKSM